jgi:NADH-quinone oxidoreductase subunit N
LTFDLQNFTVAAPLLALAAGALVILLTDLILPAYKGRPLWFLFAIGAVVTAFVYLFPLAGQKAVGFGGGLVMDPFAVVFTGIVLGVTLLAILLSLSRAEEDASGYLALMLWSAMGMILMSSAGTLMMIFLGLELLSLALYVKVAFDARQVAREAALKYFVLGSVASAFILFGFALIYGVTGTMELAAIAQKVGAASDHLYFNVGIGLSLVGFAFKLALVPFHAWAPDVYEGAPTPVTAFMSVGTKAAAFATMARFLMSAVPPEKQVAYLLPLSILAAASMLLGSTVGIWQTDLKRLMAYSGIANAGYLIMGIAGMREGGLGAAAYYLAAYGFAAMGIFAIVQLLETEGLEGSKLSELRGLYERRPGLAAALAALLFGLAGLPPTGGFIGKFLLARAAVGASDWILLSALFVSTGISAYVYLKVIGLLFKPAAEADGKHRPLMAGGQGGLSPSVVRYGLLVVLGVSLVGMFWLGLLPSTAAAIFGAGL